jgi:hypothetical protein
MSTSKYIYFILFGLTLFGGCKKVPEGFLSQYIRYEEEPIIVQKGRTKVSSALNLDGSNKPVSVKLLHIYNKATGAVVDDMFLKKYSIKGWKSQYDNKTDTTLELIAAKQFDMEVTPITINPVSGQVEANFTTLYLPAGDYVFDLEISNPVGTKQYPKIGAIQLVDAKPYEAHPEIGTPYNRMIKVGNEAIGTSLFTPTVTINRVADNPNVVVVKFVDKNGVAFNPKAGEVIRRPNTGTNPVPPFLQTLQDYSLRSTLFDDRMEFSFGVVPFPLVSLGNGFNIYYRIPTQYFKHDNLVAFPEGGFSANPRFVFRAYSPGKYEITYKFTDLVHK